MIFPRTTTVREIQRNYKKVFEYAKRAKEPIIVMKNNKPEVAIVDVRKLDEMAAIASGEVKYGQYDQTQEINWERILEQLKRIRSFRGKGQGNLSKFVQEDRLQHL